MGQGVSGSESAAERYYLQKVKLGEGSFGTVWRAVDRHTNTTVAVKQLDKVVLPKRGVRRTDIEREISVMQAVDHENVTKLYGSWEDNQSIFLALEYCNGGDFGDKVKEKGLDLEESMAAKWMYQIVSAIWVLHCKNICHRDIKPDNFMVHDEVLKLSDFGLAVHLPWGSRLTDKCGTPAFMSPEQHQLPRDSGGYSHACDVWAAGITMYMVMFAGKHPFITSGQQLDQHALMAGQLDFTISSGFLGFAMPKDRYSQTARIFCRQMVTVDFPRRITAVEARQSIWFQEQGVCNNGRSHPQHRGEQPPEEGQVPSEGIPVCKPTMPVPRPLPEEGPKPGPSESKDTSQAHSWWPFLPEAPKTKEVKETPAAATVASPLAAPIRRKTMMVTTPEAIPEPSAEVSKPDHLQQQIQDLEHQLRRLHGENMMQKQQNESQFQMLLEMQQQLKKQVTQDFEATVANIAAATPKATVEDDTSPVQRSTTRSHSQKLQTAAAVDMLPANQTVAKGMRCRYWSSTHGGRWLPACVGKVHSDGTVDLDIKPHAAIENISPSPDVAEAEAWPPGTSVSYNSSTAKRWIPAVVQSFNSASSATSVGSYNLDVRPMADCDKIRPRLLKPPEIVHFTG